MEFFNKMGVVDMKFVVGEKHATTAMMEAKTNRGKIERVHSPMLCLLTNIVFIFDCKIKIWKY